MKSGLPWFACYPSKLLGALAGMSPDEKLVYLITLLRIYEVGGPSHDDECTLSHRTGLTVKRVSAAISRLQQFGKLVASEGGLMNPVAQGEIEEQVRRAKDTSEHQSERAKSGWEKRKRNQQMNDAAGVPPAATGMPTDAHLHLHLPSSSKTKSSKQVDREHKQHPAVADATSPVVIFDDFLKVYPKRGGANPRVPAQKKFLALLKSGVEASTIIEGAKRYADDCRNRGIVGTPYVAQVVTWLNQRRWETIAGDTESIPTNKKAKNDQCRNSVLEAADQLAADLAFDAAPHLLHG